MSVLHVRLPSSRCPHGPPPRGRGLGRRRTKGRLQSTKQLPRSTLYTPWPRRRCARSAGPWTTRGKVSHPRAIALTPGARARRRTEMSGTISVPMIRACRPKRMQIWIPHVMAAHRIDRDHRTRRHRQSPGNYRSEEQLGAHRLRITMSAFASRRSGRRSCGARRCR